MSTTGSDTILTQNLAQFLGHGKGLIEDSINVVLEYAARMTEVSQ